MANGRIPKIDDDIIDFLMCTLAQDKFRTKDFERQIQDVFDQVSTNQLQDTIQILHKCIKVLESAKIKKDMQL